MDGYTHDACPKCKLLFINSRMTHNVCSGCGEKRCLFGKPRLVVHFYSVEDYITRFLRLPAYAHATHRASIELSLSNLADIGDILGGNLFREKYEKLKEKHPAVEHLFVFVFHTDAIKILDFPTASVTPFLAVNAALPAHIRFKFCAILLLALFRRNAKNLENMSETVIAELETLAETSIVVEVAQSDGTLKPSTVGIIHLVGVNDLKATPLLNQLKQAPALNGACNQCFVEGISSKGYCIHNLMKTTRKGHHIIWVLCEICQLITLSAKNTKQSLPKCPKHLNFTCFLNCGTSRRYL